MHFGQLLAATRRATGESQTALGLRVGRSLWRISKIERGVRRPRPEEVAALIAALPALAQVLKEHRRAS